MKKNKTIGKFKLHTVFTLITFICFSMSISIRAQVTAGFEVDKTEGCSPVTINFTNTSNGGGNPLSYYWLFGDGDYDTVLNPSKLYSLGDTYTVQLIVVNKNNIDDRDTVSKDIVVTQTPPATLILSSGYACANEYIEFNFSNAEKDSLTLDFDDGNISHQVNPPIYHKYDNHGSYNIKFYTFNNGCSDTNTVKTVNVDGPIADFSISRDSACIGDKITFSLGNTIAVDSILWQFGDGQTSKEDTVVYSYKNWNNYAPTLLAFGYAGSRICEITDSIYVFNVQAGFYYTNTAFCEGRNVYFQNLSSGNDNNFWNFGDGETGTERLPVHIYDDIGEYTIQLIVSSSIGCSDTTYDTINVNSVPDIELGENWFVCEGQSVQLSASGGDSISWYPSTYMDNPNSYTPTATPPSTVSYQANVYNKATLCSNSGYIFVTVQERPDWDVELELAKDTVIIGDVDTVSVTLNGNYDFYWASDDTIVSYNDTLLVTRPVVARDDYAYYNLTVKDTNNCFDYHDEIQVYVKEGYSFGIPEAFTPNGDNINDELLVHGWGIKELMEFRIYNRSGNEVFFSDDILAGWDGTLNGKPQPIDTYAYTIKVELWNGNIVDKTGTFRLIR